MLRSQLYKYVCKLVFIGFAASFIFAPLMGKNENSKLKTVVIDPGHGGKDPGALGKFSKEKDVVLAVALQLGQLINNNHTDVKVIFTRSTDVFVPLHERADVANRNTADLFISIHANANKNQAIFGAETYTMGTHTSEKNMEVAKKENAVITFEKDYSSHYEGYDPNSAESFIMFSLMQYTHLEQSLDFASIVQQNFGKHANRTDRGVRQAGFLVLWRSSMPSVLIELGYISNEKEEKYLNSETGQKELAEAIYKAFVNYKSSIERKSIFSITDSDSGKNYAATEKTQNTNLQAAQNKEPETKNNEAVNSKPQFMVQIISSQQKVPSNSPVFEKCKNIDGFSEIEEIRHNNTFKYAIGKFNEYPKTVEFVKEVKKIFPEAFVIAVINGKIISVSEAINYQN